MSGSKFNLWKRLTGLFKTKGNTVTSYRHADYNTLTFVEKLLHDVTKWKLIAVALLIVAALFAFKCGKKWGSPLGGDFIAVVEIDGVIETNSHRTKVLTELAENKNLKGVFLKINSPGGTVTGSEILYSQIKRLRDVAPVYTLIYDLGASGGYMVALGSTKIFAHESSITGSIGVLMQSLDVESLAKTIGARFKTYRSTDYKGRPDPFEKSPAAVEAYMRSTIEANHKFFASIVSKERKISDSQIGSVANGKIFIGTEALRLHLIDGISDEVTVKKMFKEELGKDYSFKEVSVKEDEDESFVSKIIDDIFRKKNESAYGARVMAIMKM